MARRNVAKDDGKCRSGREGERVGRVRPLGCRGAAWKTVARPPGGDERVAAQHDGDVVMPTPEAATFEVVEPQLALHLLVGFFRSVALLEQANDLLLRIRCTDPVLAV